MKHAMRRTIIGLLAVLCPMAAVQAATLKGPVTWGSPDQPWGVRRPVTAADRAAIAAYRSGARTPLFATDLKHPASLPGDWTLVSDDQASLKGCRRPASVATSPEGLRLQVLPAPDCHTAPYSTGYIASKAKYRYGFFEARFKIANIKGLDNAFWLTTDDNFEIDITETFYPSSMHLGFQYWPPNKTGKHAGVGWLANFVENLSSGFHDIGLLRTPTQMIYEVDGEPIAAVITHGAASGPATIRLSTVLADWAGGKVPARPEGHAMTVQSLKVFAP
jgi:hypothetical protein